MTYRLGEPRTRPEWEEHHEECQGVLQSKPAWLLTHESLVDALILLRFEYGAILDSCVPDGLNKGQWCEPSVKCLTCDLARSETALYHARGGDYTMPDCCIRPVEPLRDIQRKLAVIRENWELGGT